MGTKNNPGKFDCYANALPDEPLFTLLARCPYFRGLVDTWATQRQFDIEAGARPVTDIEMIEEARICASAGEQWRRNNNGIWRR